MFKLKSFKLDASDIGVSVLLCLFPLVIHEAYLDITFTKFAFFFLVSLVFMCIGFFSGKKDKKEQKEQSELSETDSSELAKLSMTAFFVAGLMSVFLSKYPYNSLVGYSGRYMGFDFILAILFAYVFISRNYRLKERELFLFLFSSVLVFAISFIQICGINFAHFYDGVDSLNRNRFFSTIGNVNVIASFFSMTIPVSAGLYCFKKHGKAENIFLIFTMVCGFVGSLFTNSDSAFIGIGAGMWFVCLICLNNIEHLRRFADISVILFSSIILCRLIKLLPFVNGNMSELVRIVSGRYVYIAAAAVILFDILLKKFNIQNLKKAKICYIAVSVAVAVSIIFLIIYFSCINTEAELGKLKNYLRFSDDWGTDRGAIWSMCLHSFGKFPLKNKIFGYGEDSILIALSEFSKDKMVSMGYKTDNAHNEFIQYLMTMGIFGLVSYICLAFFSLKNLITCSEKRWLCLAVAAAIIGYLAQSTVNIAQPITTPLLFVFFAFSNCVKKQNALIDINNTERGKTE